PAQAVITTEDRAGAAILHEARDEQIEFAVIVIVEPGRARGPARRGHARFVSSIGESTVAVIVIEDVPSIAGHIEVHPAITVVISSRGTHAKIAAPYPGLIRYVRKRAVVVIVVESVLQRCVRREKIRRTTIDQINVHPTVVVIIEEDSAAAAGFRQMMSFRARVIMHPGYLAFTGGNFDERHRSSFRNCDICSERLRSARVRSIGNNDDKNY